MRVLLVSDFFPPVRGGLESHVDDLATELSRRGHEVHVATLTPDPQPTCGAVRVRSVGSTASRVVRYAAAERPFPAPVPDPRARRDLRRVVDDVQPDVIHGHSWLAVSLPRGKAPLVVTAHDYAHVCQLHTLMHPDGRPCSGPGLLKCTSCARRVRGLPKAAALSAGTVVGRRLLAPDLVLTLSDYVRRRIAPSTPAEVRCVGGFLPAETASGPSVTLPDDPFVMYAGDPGGHKGLDLLFDLWGDPDRRPAATLVAAVTRPPTRATPPGVAVHAMGRQDVRAAFRQAALAVVPSLWDEPYGMVAVEALTAGTPVVASRAGALPEIVRDGVDGLLVPPGDAEALRTALQRLLGDEKARAQMSLAAKLGASRFSADTVVPRIEAAYDEVRSKARHG